MISHPGRQLKSEPIIMIPSSSPAASPPPPPSAAAGLDGVGCVRGGGGGLAFSNWPACLHCCCTAAQYSAQPPILLHSRQQPAWNAQDEADHVQISLQKRNGPDKPDQRQPKNRISVHQYCPMKKLN